MRSSAGIASTPPATPYVAASRAALAAASASLRSANCFFSSASCVGLACRCTPSVPASLASHAKTWSCANAPAPPDVLTAASPRYVTPAGASAPSANGFSRSERVLGS